MRKEDIKLICWYLDKWVKEIELDLEDKGMVKELKSLFRGKIKSTRKLKKLATLKYVQSFNSPKQFYEQAGVFSVIGKGYWYNIIEEVIKARLYSRLIKKLGEIKVDKNRNWIFPENWEESIRLVGEKMQAEDFKELYDTPN